MRARSSRALAQRSSISTARRESKLGVTEATQLGPSSAVIASRATRVRSASSSTCSEATATFSVRPRVSSRVRAVVARAPSGPIRPAAKASRASEETWAPPPEPPALGMATLTPWSLATAWTARSMRASTSAALLSGPVVPKVARSSPRMEAPSRVPSSTAAFTWAAQPSPRPQVRCTRSAIRAGRCPEGPKSLEMDWRITSLSTGPKGL